MGDLNGERCCNSQAYPPWYRTDLYNLPWVSLLRTLRLQAERDAHKGQHELQERLSRELARKLREAAYSLRQLQAGAEAEAPLLDLEHRGLAERAVQTQHCELWLRNIVGVPPGAEHTHNACGAECEERRQGECGGPAGVEGAAAGAPAGGLRLLPLQQTLDLIQVGVCGAWRRQRASLSHTAAIAVDAVPVVPASFHVSHLLSRSLNGHIRGCSVGGTKAAAAQGEVKKGGERAVLNPPHIKAGHHIPTGMQDVYRQKALQDISAARGQRPFVPLPEFLATYFTLQVRPCL